MRSLEIASKSSLGFIATLRDGSNGRLFVLSNDAAEWNYSSLDPTGEWKTGPAGATDALRGSCVHRERRNALRLLRPARYALRYRQRL
jgi:hypothetical protein